MNTGSTPYLDFGLEPEHLTFREQFRRFVQEQLEPIAIEAEAKGEFPKEAYRKLSEHGYLGVNFPEEIGGGGGDLLMGCIFYEELTRASAGISAGVFAHQHLATGPVLKFGTEAQKSEFAYPAARGERIGAFGLTEPDAGSDIRGIRSRAREVGGNWVINGSKLYITNGGIADFIVVAARTGDDRRSDSLTLFLVDTRNKGVNASELRKVGNHSSSTAFISFEDVEIAPSTQSYPDRGPNPRRQPRPRHRSGSVRMHPALRTRAKCIRPANRQVPGDRIQGRRDGDTM